MKTIGIVLVALGVIALVYGGINYNKDRTVLDVGSMNITATEHKSIPIPAVAGAVALIGGITLLLFGRGR
jgi:uncharacterized membrane protein YidH (DUF202 family)